jgi:hypothetical protein
MNLRSALYSMALLVALSAAALAAAGCGGSSAKSSATSTSSQDAARVKLAQCLRQNGVNVPDNPGQGGGQAPNIDPTRLRAATRACRKYQRAAFGNISSSQRQAFQDAFAKFSSCMRQHGVEIPTPGAGNGPPAGGNPLNQNDPKVKAATTACRSKLPTGGPGGGRPGGQ